MHKTIFQSIQQLLGILWFDVQRAFRGMHDYLSISYTKENCNPHKRQIDNFLSPLGFQNSLATGLVDLTNIRVKGSVDFSCAISFVLYSFWVKMWLCPKYACIYTELDCHF